MQDAGGTHHVHVTTEMVLDGKQEESQEAPFTFMFSPWPNQEGEGEREKMQLVVFFWQSCVTGLCMVRLYKGVRRGFQDHSKSGEVNTIRGLSCTRDHSFSLKQ